MDRPFTYLFIGIFMGIASCMFFVYAGTVSAIIISVVYFIILAKTLDKRVVGIIVGYFVLGIVSFNLYFNFNIPQDNVVVRVIEDKDYYAIAEYNGRKIKVLNNIEGLELGKIYLLNGEFRKIPNYSRGSIGNFTIDKFTERNQDFITKTYVVKKELFNKFNEKLGRYNTAILIGVCYGDSSYLSYDEMEDFNVLGISHVISVSGLHTSLIYGALNGILGYKISLVILFLYVIFTGAKAATVRAFIMIVILVLSKELKRNYDNISALSFAAFVLLLFKPYYILDAGYCLSFLGMLGIYLFYNKLQRRLYKLPMALNESISLTLAASIFTMPYVVFIFNTFTLGGIISNLIAIPFYTFVVVIGNLCLVIYKLEPVFNIFVNMLISIFSIIKTCQDFLLNIVPAPLNLSYMAGVALLMLFPTYMFIKRGYKTFIYMPIILCFLVILSDYKFTPEISFINGGAFNIAAIEFKYRTILISPQKVKISKIYERITVDEIYDEFDEDIEVSLNDKYKIKGIKQGKNFIISLLYKSKEVKFLCYDMETKNSKDMINNNDKVQVISRNYSVQAREQEEVYNKFYDDYNFPYDIIDVVKNKEVDLAGRYFKCFKVINGVVFENYRLN